MAKHALEGNHSLVDTEPLSEKPEVAEVLAQPAQERLDAAKCSKIVAKVQDAKKLPKVLERHELHHKGIGQRTCPQCSPRACLNKASNEEDADEVLKISKCWGGKRSLELLPCSLGLELARADPLSIDLGLIKNVHLDLIGEQQLEVGKRRLP